MPPTESQPERRADLFVRGDLPQPSRKRRTAVEAELDGLVSAGVLDGYGTTVWEKRVPVEGCGGRSERDRYNEFAAWAREHGACLAPFFDTRECYSTETGERRTELVMPALCLAVYEDGELARVAPFAEGGRAVSIEDCLSDLSAERESIAGRVRSSTAD